jgi:hypothetical protein
VTVTLLYVDGCPHWQEAHARVREALRVAGASEAVLTVHRVETDEQAQQLSFRGSPTVLVNGEDPFVDQPAPVGLACRLYRTATGVSGAPPVEELAAVLRRAV